MVRDLVQVHRKPVEVVPLRRADQHGLRDVLRPDEQAQRDEDRQRAAAEFGQAWLAAAQTPPDHPLRVQASGAPAGRQQVKPLRTAPAAHSGLAQPPGGHHFPESRERKYARYALAQDYSYTHLE